MVTKVTRLKKLAQGGVGTSVITLRPKPLNELSDLNALHTAAMRAQADEMDTKMPGWREEVDALLADSDEDPDAWLKRAAEKQVKANEEYEIRCERERWDYHVKRLKKHGDVGEPPPLPPLPGAKLPPFKEYQDEHWLEFGWMPFTGYGRNSPDRRYHLAWGKLDNQDYRLAVSFGGVMTAWLETSLRVVGGWIADNGFFVVKAHVSEDDVAFAFAEADGHVFHVWQRPWRFLTFLRFDADGMGYAYNDDTGTHEVRFHVE